MSSMNLIARTGRHRQRYEDNLRLVAGCIPFKIDRDGILVLMISTPKRDDLVFPKGGWENDETVEAAASREAMEEAGVLGILGEKALGMWEFRSKSSEMSGSLVGGCRGYMFALEVAQELTHWPGQANYTRKWVGIEEAFKVCRYEWMREALQTFVVGISDRGKAKTSIEMACCPGVEESLHQAVFSEHLQSLSFS